MWKKKCVKQYAGKETLRDLSFTPIKTTEQFRSAYTMHDIASSFVITEYIQRGYIAQPLGVDMRKRRVIVENELPDYVVERGEEIFCFDVKAKTSIQRFGWVNERAALSYQQLAARCNISVYVNFVQVVGSRVRSNVGYCDIETEAIERKKAWNGNIVLVYKWEKGLARIS